MIKSNTHAPDYKIRRVHFVKRGQHEKNNATPQLRIPSQMVLILLMYLGRVGGLTLIYAALSSKKVGNARLPQEKITIG